MEDCETAVRGTSTKVTAGFVAVTTRRRFSSGIVARAASLASFHFHQLRDGSLIPSSLAYSFEERPLSFHRSTA